MYINTHTHTHTHTHIHAQVPGWNLTLGQTDRPTNAKNIRKMPCAARQIARDTPLLKKIKKMKTKKNKMLRAARQIARDTSFSTCYICIWIHTHVHMDTYTRTYIHTSSTNTYIYSYQFNIYVHIFTPVHHDPPLKREGDSAQNSISRSLLLLY